MKYIFSWLLSLTVASAYCQIDIQSTSVDNRLKNNLYSNNFKSNNGNVSVSLFPVETKDTIQTSALRKSAYINDSAIKLKKIFYINTDKEGDYFFKANALSTYTQSGEFQKIYVYINDTYKGYLNSTKGEWEITGIYGKPTIFLNKGQNKVEFVSTPPFYPEVDAVEIAENEKYLITNKDKKNVVAYAENWQVTAQNIGIADNPYITAYTNVPITYTYHRKITVTSSEKITIHTTPIEGYDYYDVDPMMHLYKIDDPNNNSWYNDNSEGLHPKIEANVPAGEYYLVIRAKTNSYANKEKPSAGEVNVYYNGAILNEKVPISGFMIDSPVYNREVLSYFTNQTTGAPRIFLLDGNKMLFNSEPYTYYAPADYFWDQDTRKKIQHRANCSNWKILITAIGAWSVYYGTCDVYGSVREAPSKYLNKFPNLKSGDAVYMAEDNNKYNSAAWAGGITDRKIWIGNSNLGSPYVWTSWDNYFANNPSRYAGAETYKPGYGGAYKVAMYSSNESEAGATHFAVSNRANNQLHGFAYESKIAD